MKTQTHERSEVEALRLADNLDYLVEIGDYAGTATDAAAELRRLHEVNQKLQQQLGEAVWNYGEKVRANQELLEALKLALEALEVATTPLAQDRQKVLRAQAAIRAAIAKATGETN